MRSVELTMEEARKIAIVSCGGEEQFNLLSSLAQQQAIVGIMAVVVGMQHLGYRIAKPLVEVGKEV